MLTTREVALISVFTAFVCVTTVILKVDIPQTGGYFNIGDSMVLFTALALGPIIGGVAGGAGSMLADVILAAPSYAPGTLIIKGLEGYVTGKLAVKGSPFGKNPSFWRTVVGGCGIGIAGLVYLLGSTYYSTQWQFTLGSYEISFSISQYIWLFIALAIAGLLLGAALKLDPRFAWPLLSCMVGGSVMVLGYFLYEFFVMGLGFAAAYEVPFNLGQVLVGSILAVPLDRLTRTRRRT